MFLDSSRYMDDYSPAKKWVMHYIYEAYTKEVNGATYYFVKRYLHFPELKQVPDIKEGFGMHQDFRTACQIAGLEDTKLINQIFEQLTNPAEPAKVIDIKMANPQSDIRSNAV